MAKQTLGRTTKKRGPVPPECGRTRITVNLSNDLVPVVNAMTGKSMSDKICGLISRLSQPPVRKAAKK